MMIENKKMVKYLMKYYLFHSNKKEDDLVSYRDLLLSKNFGNIILPVLIEKLESYPTKQDLVYNETFSKLNDTTNGQYAAYLTTLKKKLSPAKINDGEIFLLSSQDNQKISLRELVNRYKGNTLIFDFWASWCLPCIKEFPSIASVEAKFSDRPVKFIGISLDEDSKISSWHNVLKKQKLNNVYQYKLISPKKSALTSFYRIESLPRYIVLNKKGELINDHFVLPSSMEFEKEIDRILQEIN
jgi:thiol-disulfide isomerase/thioredoxin